ncbi:MAG: response regulator [Sulfurimicrobium sp.]|jgi:excisionase family DNA binding protein|nr:response regulator [Sulfurimicrobium sp.]
MKKSPAYDMDYLTPTEAGKLLGVSPITLRKWADRGLIKARATLGGHRRYPLNEVERMLQWQNQPNTSPIQIMIVDDDPFISEVLQEFLSNLKVPVAVEIANNGFEAGRKLAAIMPDIILLDLMMPGMDGFDVCRRVKNDPDSSGIRVIAMTGYPTGDNIRRILSAGAEACLSKPLDHAELLAALNLPQASPGL